MLTSLDLLVILFMGFAAAALFSVCLTFLVRKPRLKKICFYIVVALGIAISLTGITINGSLFPMEMMVCAAMGILSIGSVLMERLSKGDEKKFRIAQIMATVGLIGGFMGTML